MCFSHSCRHAHSHWSSSCTVVHVIWVHVLGLLTRSLSWIEGFTSWSLLLTLHLTHSSMLTSDHHFRIAHLGHSTPARLWMSQYTQRCLNAFSIRVWRSPAASYILRRLFQCRPLSVDSVIRGNEAKFPCGRKPVFSSFTILEVALFPALFFWFVRSILISLFPSNDVYVQDWTVKILYKTVCYKVSGYNCRHEHPCKQLDTTIERRAVFST